MEVNEQENQPAVATPATEKESSPSKENVTPKAEKGWFSSLKNLRKSKSLTPVDFQKGGTLPPSSPPTSPSKFSARSTIDGVPSQDTEGSNNNSVNKSESEDTVTDSSTSYNFEPSKQESTSSDIKAEGSEGAHDSKKSTNDGTVKKLRYLMFYRSSIFISKHSKCYSKRLTRTNWNHHRLVMPN